MQLNVLRGKLKEKGIPYHVIAKELGVTDGMVSNVLYGRTKSDRVLSYCAGRGEMMKEYIEHTKPENKKTAK